jgi:hypothetical protein
LAANLKGFSASSWYGLLRQTHADFSLLQEVFVALNRFAVGSLWQPDGE